MSFRCRCLTCDWFANVNGARDIRLHFICVPLVCAEVGNVNVALHIALHIKLMSLVWTTCNILANIELIKSISSVFRLTVCDP